MPLSEDEQRILKQIEEQFYESDPSFAEKVSSPGMYGPAMRRARWAIVGLVAALGALVATLRVHFLLSFVCFLAMLACAFILEDAVRVISRGGRGRVRRESLLRRRKPGRPAK
jgi:hypothetical protein